MSEKRYIDNGYEAIEEQSFTDTETQKTYYVDYFDEVIDLVNEQDERIKELEKEKEFWRYNCMHESSRNSILKFELELAQEQGYEWSDAFEEYENSVKENSEWNKKYISEKKKW